VSPNSEICSSVSPNMGSGAGGGQKRSGTDDVSTRSR
jgi:hypothetical protein